MHGRVNGSLVCICSCLFLNMCIIISELLCVHSAGDTKKYIMPLALQENCKMLTKRKLISTLNIKHIWGHFQVLNKNIQAKYNY